MAASCHNNAVGTRSRLGEICDDGSDSYTCNGDTQEIHRSVAAIIPSTVGNFDLGVAVHRACSPSPCAKDAKDTAGKHIQEQAVHITYTCNRELILTALALSWMKIHSCQPLGDRGYMSLLMLHRENSKAEVKLVNWTDVGQWGRIVSLNGMSRQIWTTNSQCPVKKLNASTCDVILPSVESKCIMVKGAQGRHRNRIKQSAPSDSKRSAQANAGGKACR